MENSPDQSLMKRLEIDYTLGVMDVMVSLARYNFVVRTIPDASLKVLDYGCGSGYGTRVLREKFKDVTPFDLYPDDYKGDPDEVITDPSRLRKSGYDVVTCFEVIEHMDEQAQHNMMDHIQSVISEHGTLFISTVRKMDPPPTENRKKWHIRELSHEQLLAFCESRFRNVYTFAQVDQVISTFYKENAYFNFFVCNTPR